MFDVGAPELVVILAVALIVFGPKKLPEIGKTIGETLRELRRASNDLMNTVQGTGEEENEPQQVIRRTPLPAPAPEPEQHVVSTEPRHEVKKDGEIS